MLFTIVGRGRRGWRIGRVDAFRPKSHGFDSRSNRHVGTMGKSFTHSCLWRSEILAQYPCCVESASEYWWTEEAL